MPVGAGSNNWAVAPSLTGHGGAILANDMHLGMYVPNTWYRASLVYNVGGERVSVTGVTLPGGPAVVAGSNSRIAWGFTNSMGDWADLVILEPGPDSETYLTPDGARPYEHVQETIRVRLGPDEHLELLTTIWGPLFDVDYQSRRRALQWVAYDSRAVNLGLLELQTADSVFEAIERAAPTGIPAQNFTVVDSEGNIGWTIAGPIPKRFGHDGRVPRSWANGTCGWDGWFPSDENPRIINPEIGRIWTANARVVTGEDLEKIGDGGYRFASRARQIRKGLLTLKAAREVDMLKIQLDDRAVFMESWRDLLLGVLTRADSTSDPILTKVRGHVEKWGGRAAADSVGYRIVRRFHDRVSEKIFGWLLEPCIQRDPDFDYNLFQDKEAPLLRLVTEQPEALLHPSYAGWQELFRAAIDEVIGDLTQDGENLKSKTWGAYNTVESHHPLSQLFSPFGWWLNMDPYPLPGDRFIPRVQTPRNGASERLVVSPGREAEGILHMPCGQSGHPLSPHYSDGHAAWVKGEASPFLPGPAVNILTLLPGAESEQSEAEMP
jgi:penicillin amidase